MNKKIIIFFTSNSEEDLKNFKSIRDNTAIYVKKSDTRLSSIGFEKDYDGVKIYGYINSGNIIDLRKTDNSLNNAFQKIEDILLERHANDISSGNVLICGHFGIPFEKLVSRLFNASVNNELINKYYFRIIGFDQKVYLSTYTRGGTTDYNDPSSGKIIDLKNYNNDELETIFKTFYTDKVSQCRNYVKISVHILRTYLFERYYKRTDIKTIPDNIKLHINRLSCDCSETERHILESVLDDNYKDEEVENVLINMERTIYGNAK